MDLLPVAHPRVLDGAIGTPVGDRGERVMAHAPGPWPLPQDDRREDRDPVDSARRDGALRPPDRLPDGEEVGVAGESPVEPFLGPQLVEHRIEVEVHANGRAAEEVGVGEDARDVDHDVRPARDLQEVAVREADGLSILRHQGGPSPQAEGSDQVQKVNGVDRPFEREAGRRKRFGPHGLDEPHIVAQSGESEHVLQDGPRRTALTRHPAQGPAHQDPQTRCGRRHGDTSTSSSIRDSTRSESKYSSAIARAAFEWRSLSDAISPAPPTASSSVRNVTRPSPTGSVRSNPVLWTSAGLPEARYRTVRSLTHPLYVSTYMPWATENSAPESCTYRRNSDGPRATLRGSTSRQPWRTRRSRSRLSAGWMSRAS